MNRTIEFSGGRWDVVHQANKFRHKTCFFCDGALCGFNLRLPATYGWIIRATESGIERRRSAYACENCPTLWAKLTVMFKNKEPIHWSGHWAFVMARLVDSFRWADFNGFSLMLDKKND